MKIKFFFLVSFLLTSTITLSESPYFFTIYLNKFFIKNNITYVRLEYVDQLSLNFYENYRLNELLDENDNLMLKTRSIYGTTYKLSPNFENDFFDAYKNFLHELNVEQTPPLPPDAGKKKHHCVIL